MGVQKHRKEGEGKPHIRKVSLSDKFMRISMKRLRKRQKIKLFRALGQLKLLT